MADKRRAHEFVVSLVVPEGVTIPEMAEYVRAAVACWAGSKDPDSAIYDLDKAAVRVRHVRKDKPRKGG